MGAGTWYVDSTRTAVNWGSAVSAGAAVVDIYRVVVDGSSHEQTYLWRKAGATVTTGDVTAAQAETTGGAVPAPILPVSPIAPGGVDIAGMSIGDGSVTLVKLAADVKASFLRRTVTSIAVSTTAPSATSGMDYLYICTAPLTLTLPTAVGTSGWYTVKNSSSGSVSIVPPGTEHIGGGISVGLSAGGSATFGSDGTTWFAF